MKFIFPETRQMGCLAVVFAFTKWACVLVVMSWLGVTNLVQRYWQSKFGSPSADRTASFILYPARTFMYHAHYEQQDSELYGMIGITKAPTKMLLVFHLSPMFGSSLLIDRREKIVCSIPGIATALYNYTSIDCSPHAIIVSPGKTYRLRIGCQTALAALSFEIEKVDK
ncbi:hypothetical protein CTI12_AA193250 [Artemisia annua]|uniref:Plastocyanin-like domain-containing protein n=1 Tax=Artemisia annua TaxID=35608 RepID=A0A2U1P529_ARTAN|nr:hypothetical protein CTI12_AA193250 [Artemisia annua]